MKRDGTIEIGRDIVRNTMECDSVVIDEVHAKEINETMIKRGMKMSHNGSVCHQPCRWRDQKKKGAEQISLLPSHDIVWNRSMQCTLTYSRLPPPFIL